MAGAGVAVEISAVQEKPAAVAAVASAGASASPPVAAAAAAAPAPAAQESSPSASPASGTEATAGATPPAAVIASGVNRGEIARVVASVLAAQGISRGSGLAKAASDTPQASAPQKLASPVSIAAEIADRLFGSPARAKEGASPQSASAKSGGNATAIATAGPGAVEKKAPSPAAAEIQMFVSENDVRRAMTRSEKIFIGRKTILTPSARDLGLEHEVFVETETGSIR